MLIRRMAGVAVQPLSIYINGCDKKSAISDPAKVLQNPRHCRTFEPRFPLQIRRARG